MQNIDIRDFTTVSTVETYDHVVISLFGGAAAKMKVSLLRDVLVRGITPSIGEDGTWYVGESATGVTAEGKTPEFRKGVAGIEYKYTFEEEGTWRTLVSYSELRMRYEDLTEEQAKSLKLSFNDLTEEDIKELQKPAEDMISRMEETDSAVKEAETLRAEAETGRTEAEQERAQAEQEREEAEKLRESSEKERESAETARALEEYIREENEGQRILSENVRSESEAERKSAESARESGERTRISQESARVSAENARVAAESSRVSAESGRVEEFARLKAESEAATASAQDTADHPTYIGEDNYVYEWDKTAKTYNKTSVYVRGEAFSIRKVYASVDEMHADTGTSFREGDFCLINTGDVEEPENAQIFVRTAAGGWEFVVDMSGAIGFTGKTPQFSVGTVSVGNGKASAAVTIAPGGTDADGNPRYLINYVIPCLAYEDLTAEQITELQRPASDMIAQLQRTEDSVKEAEALRVSAEESRSEEFARLKSESETATSNADTATAEANAARDAANTAAQAADSSSGKADAATGKADAATARANTAADNAEAATADVNTARDAANAAAQAANESAANADASALKADGATADAIEATAGADNAAENANDAASSANAAAGNANAAALTANGSATKADEAANDATLAAQQARNLPKIQNGTWWLYDIEQGVYVDSGYAVNNEYRLTREKVEEVLTGEVESHWHDRYVDKVEGKQLSTEDFTTVLKEKLEGLGNYDDTEIAGAVEKLRKDFDALVSGDTADAIDSFNEVVAFLEGVNDTQSLSGIIASIEQQIGKKADSTSLPTKVSQLENDVPYVTSGELSSGLAGKQDVNLYFENVEASVWVEDTTYAGMKYRCDIPLEGVTKDMVPEVIFGFKESTSGDYAPVAETKDGILSVWSATDKSIVIPTIIINK